MTPRQTLSPSLRGHLPVLAAAHDQLTIDLLSILRARTGNVAFSPFSIGTGLALTLAGAAGETASELREALRLPDDFDAVDESFGELQKLIVWKDGPVQVANRLWGRPGHRYHESFLELTRDHYGAELAAIDFNQPVVAADRINRWVADQTNGRITEVVSPRSIYPDTALILTNAVYFKSDWRTRFDVGLTEPRPFWLTPQQQIDVPTMMISSRYAYADVGEAEILNVPYIDERFAMLLVRPKDIDGVAKLELKLSEQTLVDWRAALREEKVDLSLPKFALHCRIGLRASLAELGVSSAFNRSGQADFSNLTGGTGVFLSEAVHEAFVRVDEKGTEATAVSLEHLGGRRGDAPIPFIVDRPFLFLIWDDLTKTTLFMGRVENPTIP